MRRLYILTIFLLTLSGCAENNSVEPEPEPEPFKGPYKIANGCYMGNFIISGQKLKIWSEICFDTAAGKYTEWPSGGVMYQKEWGCLSVGTYSVDSFRLTFTLDSLKFKILPCPMPDTKLPGEYRIINIIKRDSIIFERLSGGTKLTYYMKRVWP